MPETAICYAVVEYDKILVDTVHSSRRGAQVNYLVAVCGVPVFQSHSDRDIMEMFTRQAEMRKARVTNVWVSTARADDVEV